jgi:5-methylcytosine-specific restriction endonuclease McrA
MAAWKAKNPEKAKAFHKRWQQNNLAKCRAANAKRHAAKLRAVPPWAETDLIEVVYAKAREFGLEVDHIVPLQHPLVCGLHVWHNLQLLHESENAKKKNYHWPDMP